MLKSFSHTGFIINDRAAAVAFYAAPRERGLTTCETPPAPVYDDDDALLRKAMHCPAPDGNGNRPATVELY